MPYGTPHGCRPAAALALGLACSLAALPACTTVPDNAGTFAVPAGDYTQAFNAARDVLIDRHFVVERVDAAGGVITTEPRQGAGLLTPWDASQSSTGQEFEEFVHQHEREVRVRFVPQGTDDAGSTPLTQTATPLTAEVEVLVYRRRWPGWRLETESPRTSTRTTNMVDARHGVAGPYRTAVERDRDLEKRLAAEIAQRLYGDMLTAVPIETAATAATISSPETNASLSAGSSSPSSSQPSSRTAPVPSRSSRGDVVEID